MQVSFLGVQLQNGRKEYKASRGGLERICGGERVIICTRERKGEKPICSSRLSRSCLTLSRAYKSCFGCRTLISNWIDRCFGQHLWNSVHSLSRDNPRIPTNPLSGSRQPPLLWFGASHTTAFCDPISHMLVCNAYIWAFFVRIYMRVCKKMVIYLRKTHLYRVAEKWLQVYVGKNRTYIVS